MDIVERFGIEFVIYEFQKDAKIWWQSHIECRPTEAPPMSWATFSYYFMEKYILWTLRDKRRDEFLNIEQRRMSIVAYEAKFRALARYATQLCFSPEERIRHFVAASVKSFQQVVDFVIKVEGVSQMTLLRRQRSRSFVREVFDGGSSKTSHPFSNFRGYLQSSSSSRRPTFDLKTYYKCGEPGHIRKYCLRQSQTLYNQGYIAPLARGGGGYGWGHHFGGRSCQGRGDRQSGWDCNANTVTLAKPEMDQLVWEGDYLPAPVRIISFIHAKKLVSKGCLAFLAQLKNDSSKVPSIESISIVRVFINVFTTDLPGMPPDRYIDFCIYMELDTRSISIPPYRMAPIELRELKAQLQELLGKGFIRPSASP
ncbi:uncharacterized protein LOC129875684 [Solanum dulcamara]|uniref:uncharacterized protein LOC129875684 n=1 Tax=Solanum dulcamara TaxID=45834 RepID=UPI002485429C|nr:uncharacterized protein LOC129875684 [Solanum dulcamara]